MTVCMDCMYVCVCVCVWTVCVCVYVCVCYGLREVQTAGVEVDHLHILSYNAIPGPPKNITCMTNSIKKKKHPLEKILIIGAMNSAYVT